MATVLLNEFNIYSNCLHLRPASGWKSLSTAITRNINIRQQAAVGQRRVEETVTAVLAAAGDNLYSENINFRDVSHLQPSLHSLPPPSRAARGHALLMLKKFNDSNETTQVLRPSGFMLQVQVHPCLICFLQNILYL